MALKGTGTFIKVDPDLTAIAELSGTSGFLKKTAENTWELDTSSFATTGHNHSATYQPLDNELTLLSALSTTGNESKYIRLNSGGNAFEFASLQQTWQSYEDNDMVVP